MPTDTTPPTMTWEDVEPAALDAFHVWTHGRELAWAKAAWGHLSDAGLTAYTNGREWCEAGVRFLALAQVYRDWCLCAHDQDSDDRLTDWAWGFKFHDFHLGQLIGADPDFDDIDSLALTRNALQHLTAAARLGVVAALYTGFNGEDNLFLSLWRINYPAPPPKSSLLPLDADVDKEAIGEDDYDVMMNPPTDEKICAYGWIADGCPSLSP